MAHELKTPLTVIRNSLEMALTKSPDSKLEKEVGAESEPNDPVLDAIHEIDRLSKVISDFLLWAQTERGLPGDRDVEELNLAGVCADTCRQMESANGRKILFKADSSLQTVSCSRNLLSQVLVNLLGNALKYSSVDHCVEVVLEKLKLKISDFGPGLEANVLAKLGEPFNVGHVSVDGERVRHGSGLGLAWVSAICRHYDWKLSIQNGPHGAEVSIQFPS